jgi:hypothetical protein
MNKKKLIFIGCTDFTPGYISNIFKDYYDIEYYNTFLTYDKNLCTLVVTYNKNTGVSDEDLCVLLDRGFKLIIVNTWEARSYFIVEKFKPYLDNILLILGCKNPYNIGWKHVIGTSRWFWYNECLWYRELDYHYVPDRVNNKLFLMPMKRQRPHRTQTRAKLQEFLDRAIWSYVEAWENPQRLSTTTELQIAPDRTFDPTWYNQTFFSVVVETAVNRATNLENEILGKRPQDLACDLFVTEKTFKPIAFQHPFVICGMPETLEFLHDNGFETYDHIFDESYDTLNNFDDRLDIIYNNIKNFSKEKYSDPLTEQKMKHNYNHFYNIDLVLQGITKDIIEPMTEWIDAH